LYADAAVIRNRRKTGATIHNAQRFLQIEAQYGSYRRWFVSLMTNTPDQRDVSIGVFREKFRFMGPETTRCYLMGVGKIPAEHEPGCWLAG
jgi:DNA-3-methyladenine glycosylase I